MTTTSMYLSSLLLRCIFLPSLLSDFFLTFFSGLLLQFILMLLSQLRGQGRHLHAHVHQKSETN